VAIRNVWSLPIDEAIAADKLKQKLGKNYEVFFPVNSQLPAVDLIIFHLKNMVAKTVQVKGSRTYGEDEEQQSWTTMPKKSTFNPKNKIDFFIFVIHYVSDDGIKKFIAPHFIIIPFRDYLAKIKKGKKLKSKHIHHYFWLDLKKKEAWDNRDLKNRAINFSKYLDNFELLKK